MKAFIDGLVYLVVALAYLLYEVLRIIVSAFRREQQAGEAPVTATPSPARAMAPAAAQDPAKAAKEAKGARAEPDPNQIPLFESNGGDPADAGGLRTRRGARAPRKSAAPKRNAEKPAANQSMPLVEDVPAAPGTRTRSESRAAQHKGRWVGTLEDFGIRTFTDTKSKGASAENPRRYQSFYVSIETEDGGLVIKQGVELEKAIEISGAQIGDCVELLFLGKEPVEVEEDGEKVTRHRNRWRINII
ncbi:MAG: hypothetical protein ACOZCP_19310 [Pseudomonadota bacterium]|jgi:hypothetical protein